MTDLNWPTGFERTPANERTKNRNYEVTLSKALDDLDAELDRLDADDYRFSTDANQRQRDNRPYANANPDDPSAVVRWTMDGDQFAVACDRFSRLRDNVRTIGLYIREKRKMEQRPVETGASEFANARLPSGENDATAADVPPHAVLGVERDADEKTIRDTARELKIETHPDHGGSSEELARVLEAEEAMLG
jgi:hypothetical protein